MPKQIVIAGVKIVHLRYHTDPEPCVRVAFELEGQGGEVLFGGHRFDMAWELSKAEAKQFEQFIERHILSRLRKEVGLEEKEAS